jgi:hypothetical protein
MDPAGTRRLRLKPAPSADTALTIYYHSVPPLLEADDDSPLVPQEYLGYLIEAARVDLLHGIEERVHLWEEAVRARDSLLAEMRRRDQAILPSLDRDGVGAFA